MAGPRRSCLSSSPLLLFYSRGGVRGQLREINGHSLGANSFFSRPAPAFGQPPMVRAGHRRRPIFFADNRGTLAMPPARQGGAPDQKEPASEPLCVVHLTSFRNRSN
jgi:hypothetical protein